MSDNRRSKRAFTSARISLGLVAIVVSSVMITILLGLIPDANQQRLEKIAVAAETAAANSSVLLTAKDMRRLETILWLVVSRNPDLITAGVRRADGRLVVDIGDHQGAWHRDGEPQGQLQVPVFTDDQQWGQLEFTHVALPGSRWLELYRHPSVPLVGVVAAISFVLMFLYLSKVLKELDPSQAVPDRVRSALDTMAEGLLLLDGRLNIVLANQAFAELVGLSSDALIGEKPDIFDWLDGNNQPMSADSWPWTQALVHGRVVHKMRVRLRLANGRLYSFQSNCAPVFTAPKKPGGVLISFDDVTLLEEKEKQLQASMLEAEQANQAKSDFLANMSHEIRTPMNAIMGFTDVLMRAYQGHGDAKLQQDTLHYLTTIAKSSQHLLNLINSILDLSKVESGHIEIERSDTDIHGLCQEVLQVLAVQADSKGLQLNYRAESSLPESLVTDAGKIRQVITNLVGNAIKFTETGSVTLACRWAPAQSGGSLTLSVTDTGIGMTEPQRAQVFNAFVQADSSITRRFGGTGLGLSISRHFAQALGGDISVASELGKGSVFSLSLPISQASEVMLLPEALEHRPEQHRGPGPSVAFVPATVLVVDDGEENRELLTVVLGNANLKVVSAANGLEALAQMHCRPAMVLMDVQMPKMDGYTAVGKMRQANYQGPVIALTAHAMKGIQEKCLAAGFTGYLSKPIDIDRLLGLMAKYLPVQKHESASRPLQSGQKPPITGATAGEAQVRSSLMDNERYRPIVEKFVQRLGNKLEDMDQALAAQKQKELVDLAHWLKGSGGTAGFNQFTGPAGKLEEIARSGKWAEVSKRLEEIHNIYNNIDLSTDLDVG